MRAYKGKSCGPGGIQFMYTVTDQENAVTYHVLAFPERGRYVYISCVVKALG